MRFREVDRMLKDDRWYVSDNTPEDLRTISDRKASVKEEETGYWED